MPEFWDKFVESATVTSAIATAKKAYGFIYTQIWPVYSTGAIVGFMFLIASMHEKQVLADTMFGMGKMKEEEGVQLVTHASQLLDDEVQHAVKVDVFSLPVEEFRREYSASGSL